MKRKIAVGVALGLTLALVLNMSVFAAWVGSLRGEAQISNPVQTVQFLSPQVEIAPGQAFDFGGEIPNRAPIPYGLRAYGWIWFAWQETGEIVEISLEEISENGEICISAPSIAAGPPEIHLGTIELYLDGQFQSLGSVFNIEPHQVIEVQIVVRTLHSVPAGKVSAEVSFYRGAPAY